MSTYFISDIHLHANSTTQQKMLIDFLRSKGPTADAIYILGDLFAIWLGDDLNEPYSQELTATLKELSVQNVPLFFMRGNRDFLVGEKFARESGCKLLADPYKIDLYGREILLTHGDLLCTLDLNYQKFRRLVQNPFTKHVFLLLPTILRKKLGLWVKRKANRAPQNPAAYDVAPDTVDEWFSKHAVHTIIHGHTHRPAIHEKTNNKRYVLGDWTATSAKILICEPDNYWLQDLATD